jgi:tetratricopeptide (TPR) repeat protein
VLDYAVTEARLKIRGLRYELRPETDVPRRKRLTVDACRTAARVLSMTDPLRSGAFQSRQLLEALDAGERSRLTTAVTFSAIYASAMNRDSLADELLNTAEALATDGDPAAEFHAALARSASAYMRGHIAESASALGELAEQRPPGSDLGWSLHFAQLTAIGGYLLVGSFARCLDLVKRVASDAKERGDEYSYSNVMLHTAQWEWLAADDPDRGRAALERAMRDAPREMTFVLEWGADQTMDLVDQYAGESERAFGRTPQKWAWKGRSYRHYRLQRWWRAFLAGGIAATCMRDRSLRRQAHATAERYARFLGKDADPWPRAMSASVYAAIAFRQGNTARAAELLQQATAGFDALGLGMYALATRRERGLVLGGETGQALIDEVDSQLRSQGVKNPARFVESFVAGFVD